MQTEFRFDTEYNGFIGHVIRDEAVSFLTTAYSEGYLTAGQHDARTAQALAARTAAELRAAVSELPTELRLQRPQKNAAPPVSPVTRWLRYAATACATACICMWALAGTDGNSPYSGPAEVTGFFAVFLILLAAAVNGDWFR